MQTQVAPGAVQEVQALRLFDVARRSDIMQMHEIINKYPRIALDARDAEGCTPLHAAASSGSVEMAQLLQRVGANVTAKDQDGWEPLHYACANGHYGMAAWLLQRGASLSGGTTEGWQPLHVAAHTGQLELARFLVEQGADIRARTTTGHEAIHLAVDAACTPQRAMEFVHWVLRSTRGEAALARDDDGWMPLHSAAHNGHLEILKLLHQELAMLRLLHRPSASIDLEVTTVDGCTPLHLAAIAAQVDVTTWLLHKGANPDAVTADGFTAKRLAAIYGCGTTQAVFAQAGIQDFEAASDARSVTSAEEDAGARLLGRNSKIGAATRAAESHKRWAQGGACEVSTGSLDHVSGAAPKSESRLAIEVRAQAAHYIDSTLSRSLLIKDLRNDLSVVMEKGKVYTPLGTKTQLVTWKTRFFYCSEEGLCYQKVDSKKRPYGEKRVIPWVALTKVEALVDNSIYVETVDQKKYYLKLKDVSDAADASWDWASKLCQLCQLLGNVVSGYVASATQGRFPVDALTFKQTVVSNVSDDGLASARLPPPSPSPYLTVGLAQSTASAHYGLSAMTGAPSSAISDVSPRPRQGGAEEEEEEEGEGEETAEEAYRRRQWILYYVSNGQYDEAEDIGWDRITPPDAREIQPTAAAPGSSNVYDDPRTPQVVSLGWLQQRMGQVGTPFSTPGASRSRSRADEYEALADGAG